MYRTRVLAIQFCSVGSLLILSTADESSSQCGVRAERDSGPEVPDSIYARANLAMKIIGITEEKVANIDFLTIVAHEFDQIGVDKGLSCGNDIFI